MAKKRNLVQKFRKFFFSLPKDEQKALWDIMTALRSEDGGNFKLKLFTTSRIRGALVGETNLNFMGGIAFTSPKLAEKYFRRNFPDAGQHLNLKSSYKEADLHFRNHFDSAIKALLKHGFKGKVADLKDFIW